MSFTLKSTACLSHHEAAGTLLCQRLGQVCILLRQSREFPVIFGVVLLLFLLSIINFRLIQSSLQIIGELVSFSQLDLELIALGWAVRLDVDSAAETER